MISAASLCAAFSLVVDVFMQHAEDRKIADEVLEDFASFAAIPRPSLHEKAISDYLPAEKANGKIRDGGVVLRCGAVG